MGPGDRSRANVVAELETTLLEEYRDPALVSKPEETVVPWRCVLIRWRRSA